MPACGSKFVSGSSRVYSIDRPRSRSRMLSLVGDSGQVLGCRLGFN